MKLESLPNELLLDVFDYMDDIELLRIFYNLNSRFNRLLLDYSKKFYLNFQSIRKKDLDFICQQSLPRIIDQIVAIHLSDDNDTPYQTAHFFSYSLHFRQFIHLQTLSLYHIRCANALNKILLDLSQLRHLTCLKIDQIHFDIDEIDHFVQTIWSLSTLIYFYIADPSFLSYHFMSDLVISTSLKHLYLMESHFVINQLTHLFQCTPHLEKLSIAVYQDSTYDNLFLNQSVRAILPPLTKLNIKFVGNSDGLEYIFQLMPNLYDLKIETLNLNMDGYEWEEMICNYLSKLKVFQLQMSFRLPVDNNTEDLVDEILSSFQTSFWIDERQLFFRCHWDEECLDRDQCCSALLYTLPYAFDTFDYSGSIYSKSTCSDKSDYWSYNCVHTLCNVPAIVEQDISHFPVRLQNVRHLTVGYKLGNVGIICPILDQLTTLYIQCLDCQVQSHLQGLLDRAPQLHTIKFYKNNWLYFFVASKSVRRVILRDGIYYNVQQCTELCSSTLFNQCEILEINIRAQNSVLDFLRTMPNLRTLIFQCQHDEWKQTQTSSLSKNDKLVNWLQRYLPSECLIKREKTGLIQLCIC